MRETAEANLVVLSRRGEEKELSPAYALDALPGLRDTDIVWLTRGISEPGNVVRYGDIFYEHRGRWLCRLSPDEIKGLGLRTGD